MDPGGLALASSALGIAALAAAFARFCAFRPSHATASTSAATAAYNVFVFIDKTSLPAFGCRLLPCLFTSSYQKAPPGRLFSPLVFYRISAVSYTHLTLPTIYSV